MTGATRIRHQQAGDEVGIRIVNERAFGRPDEANLVDRLTQGGHAALSLVATDVAAESRIVGHILFTPIEIDADDGRRIEGLALAPLAVLPEWQNRGVGSALTREALSEIRATTCPFVIVLGHPEYYPRFGFETASRYGVRCQWEVRDEVWMILVLDRAALDGIPGVARYLPEFGDL